MKKNLLILALALTAGVLVGCGNQNASTQVGTEQAPATQQATTNATTAAPVQQGGLLAGGTINKAFPSALTYVPNDETHLTPEYYGDGGLKIRFTGIGAATTAFAARDSVTVNVKINALNSNTKESNGQAVFTIKGYNASGAQVATATLETVVVGDNNVTLTGSAIVKVEVILTNFPVVDGKCCNVSLGAVEVK